MAHGMQVLADAEQLWAGALGQVRADVLDDSSGCADWTNRDLINHVAGGGHRYSMLLTGASAEDTAATRNSDYVGTDPVAEFWRYENLFVSVARSANLDLLVDHRAGRRTGRELLTMRVMDLTLHTHDLCCGIDVAWEPPERVTKYLLTDAAAVIEELRGLGLFGAACTPRSASSTDRLLAFAGRS
ncbi:hypothetical protein GOEFS_075_00290 [Gordonia effusa NBRC 100432]|uniref:Mycothiol-dependent maleylpyruvate isomerase metal-binding domain-containing protein n=1 Tax=Gordonia effusa NBRC 100432 TaxID=1077974 RepID=H0R203_9ACTN|nr:maleylpyruvate isomerase N-terminal domain-containing protein [Gordonia effusa]GAB19108.1 hypothetical protein GOEFS_075_00290 [Gordonia effusa NBRC 100432]